ncbi:hypothetical protein Bxe_A0249 [Paraburkholderia xenovorans LB400]|uniref:Uncharacterized protein n=1 Tax=Paraburkholderia xenovorans (strain LB400) TaxID=266265 RepID=Q13TA5_PARXL|nr:hypothetical protein Bxe_A0249 [Paraburkholderia xenovorans LB400]
MTPRIILYLAVEGVLLSRSVTRSQLRSSEFRILKDSPHVARLAELLALNRQTDVVLNSRLVLELGFRALLQLFPTLFCSHIVGATIHGNRLIRCRQLSQQCGRCAWLSADAERRQAGQLVVLEHDARCVPVPFRDRAIIVSSGLEAATSEDWRRLRDLLEPHEINSVN